MPFGYCPHSLGFTRLVDRMVNERSVHALPVVCHTKVELIDCNHAICTLQAHGKVLPYAFPLFGLYKCADLCFEKPVQSHVETAQEADGFLFLLLSLFLCHVSHAGRRLRGGSRQGSPSGVAYRIWHVCPHAWNQMAFLDFLHSATKQHFNEEWCASMPLSYL